MKQWENNSLNLNVQFFNNKNAAHVDEPLFCSLGWKVFFDQVHDC